MRIYLIGFMGAGKTSIGKKLARKINFQFVDLDDLIEAESEQKITEIFEEKGENYFRKLEQKVLFKTLKLENVIIATGGGTPCFYENMAWINKNGKSIYLKLNAGILHSRLKSKMKHRPMLQNKKNLQNFIETKLQEREKFYELAHFTISMKEKNAFKKLVETIEI